MLGKASRGLIYGEAAPFYLYSHASSLSARAKNKSSVTSKPLASEQLIFSRPSVPRSVKLVTFRTRGAVRSISLRGRDSPESLLSLQVNNNTHQASSARPRLTGAEISPGSRATARANLN